MYKIFNHILMLKYFKMCILNDNMSKNYYYLILKTIYFYSFLYFIRPRSQKFYKFQLQLTYSLNVIIKFILIHY